MGQPLQFNCEEVMPSVIRPNAVCQCVVVCEALQEHLHSWGSACFGTSEAPLLFTSLRMFATESKTGSVAEHGSNAKWFSVSFSELSPCTRSSFTCFQKPKLTAEELISISLTAIQNNRLQTLRVFFFLKLDGFIKCFKCDSPRHTTCFYYNLKLMLEETHVSPSI